MTYASAFERDIFISYCHTDNENPVGDGPAALPRLARVQLNAVPAAQQVSIEGEVLASSSGAPNQAFGLARGQLLGEPCFARG